MVLESSDPAVRHISQWQVNECSPPDCPGLEGLSGGGTKEGSNRAVPDIPCTSVTSEHRHNRRRCAHTEAPPEAGP